MKRIDAISIIGLGKLGLCMAACFASKGYKVIGVDIDKAKIDLLNKGENPIQETGLTRILTKFHQSLKYTTDYREAVFKSQVTFIVVGTPSNPGGSFTNKYIEESLREIGLVLRNKKEYHLVVVTSTLMPQTMGKQCKFILEDTSQKRRGLHFGLVYNPEFIALGSVIHDFFNPNFILIGEENKNDGDMLVSVYKNICENKPTFARMNYINAEIAKLSLNCYITTKITFANFLGAVCQQLPNADAHIITAALGLDARIGSRYFSPGLGFGGPCFPRDNLAFSAFASQLNMQAKLSQAVDQINKEQAIRIVRKIETEAKKIRKDKDRIKIGLLGLSYKPETPVVDDSQAISIAKSLIADNYHLVVYDPQALESARVVLGNRVAYAKNALACLDASDIAVVATPWEEFKKIRYSTIKNKHVVILDCWHVIKDSKFKIKYIDVGETS